MESRAARELIQRHCFGRIDRLWGRQERGVKINLDFLVCIFNGIANHLSRETKQKIRPEAFHREIPFWIC